MKKRKETEDWVVCLHIELMACFALHCITGIVWQFKKGNCIGKYIYGYILVECTFLVIFFCFCCSCLCTGFIIIIIIIICIIIIFLHISGTLNGSSCNASNFPSGINKVFLNLILILKQKQVNRHQLERRTHKCMNRDRDVLQWVKQPYYPANSWLMFGHRKMELTKYAACLHH